MRVPAAIMHLAVPVRDARHVGVKSTWAPDKRSVRENHNPGRYTGKHNCIICKFETINNTLHTMKSHLNVRKWHRLM